MELTPPNPLSPLSAALPWDSIVQVGALCILGVYVIFTAIFFYHWQQYNMNAAVARTTYIIYGCTTLPLVLGIGIVTLAL